MEVCSTQNNILITFNIMRSTNNERITFNYNQYCFTFEEKILFYLFTILFSCFQNQIG